MEPSQEASGDLGAATGHGGGWLSQGTASGEPEVSPILRGQQGGWCSRWARAPRGRRWGAGGAGGQFLEGLVGHPANFPFPLQLEALSKGLTHLLFPQDSSGSQVGEARVETRLGPRGTIFLD